MAGAVAADYAATGCFMNLTCFVADTPIATEQGFKKIQDLQVGERVWAYSFTRQQLELSTVTQTFRNTVGRLVDVTVAGQIIMTTEEHPFWVVGQGWTPAKTLQAGDQLCRLDGTAIAVQAVRIRSEHVTVYNFEVAEDHDYFVSNLGVLVHNECIGPYSQLKSSLSGLKSSLSGWKIQVHHLIEQRFAKELGYSAITKLSVVLTAAEHQAFTNQWRSWISYGAGTGAATAESVMETAQKIYANHPGILNALGF